MVFKVMNKKMAWNIWFFFFLIVTVPDLIRGTENSVLSLSSLLLQWHWLKKFSGATPTILNLFLSQNNQIGSMNIPQIWHWYL